MKNKRIVIAVAIISACIVVFCAVTIVKLIPQTAEKSAKIEELQDQIMWQKQENEKLQDAIDNIDSDDSIRAIAREQIGMVDPDEIVFVDADK